MKNKQSGFKINKLLLLESNFKRINDVQYNEDNPELNMDINTEVGIQNNVITVAETVTLVYTYQNSEQFSFHIKMVGIFECIGENQLTDFESFGKINGAAIIFPYIREHISNLSVKAGLIPIILPPINFTNNK